MGESGRKALQLFLDARAKDRRQDRRTDRSGDGRPVPWHREAKYLGGGHWTRKITEEHRLFYSGDVVYITSCYGHDMK